MIEIVDAIRDILEPPDPLDETYGLSGARRDLSCAMPFTPEPGTLYIAEDDDRENPVETGEASRRDFAISAVYVVEGQGENAEASRSRDVSIALDEKREAYIAAISANRANSLWDHLLVTADADAIRELQVRGVALRISGYRFPRL